MVEQLEVVEAEGQVSNKEGRENLGKEGRSKDMRRSSWHKSTSEVEMGMEMRKNGCVIKEQTIT